MKVGWIDDPRFELHEQEAGHPESPARVRAIRDAVAQAGLKLVHLAARKATREELLWVHAPEYIDFAEECCLDPEGAVLGPDVRVQRGSWEAALLAAGSAVEACRTILDGGVERAFGNLRPPGHHALRDGAMGFCIFNNVALAAKAALEEAGLARVAIVDWDVHHGNGTQDCFLGDPRVLYCSMHQFPFYPGTGSQSQANAFNLPLPMGCSSERYLQVFRESLLPRLDYFRPELILISCGFDGHKDDALGQLSLDASTYAEMTSLLSDCSLRHSQGRILSLLEGGYTLPAIAHSAVAHIRELLKP
jgi:acetoin utilization deacetylase AcuC-like enzyme